MIGTNHKCTGIIGSGLTSCDALIHWNLPQGWAARSVISTATDMQMFIEALLRDHLFDNFNTLTKMQAGIASDMGLYGIGLIEKLPYTWGHGGQTLGFESEVAYVVDESVSVIIWTNKASNLAGAQFVNQALIAAGIVDVSQE